MAIRKLAFGMQPEGFPLELKVGSAHVLNNSAEPQAFEVNLIFNLRLHFFDIFGIAGTQLHCAGQYTCKAGRGRRFYGCT